MKTDKILKQFQLFYKNSRQFQFAVATRHQAISTWRDDKPIRAMYLAFTENSIFVGTSQPKSTLEYEFNDLANLYYFEVDAEAKSNDYEIVLRAFETRSDWTPIFSLTIERSHVPHFKNSLIEFGHEERITYLTQSQMANSELSNPSKPPSSPTTLDGGLMNPKEMAILAPGIESSSSGNDIIKETAIALESKEDEMSIDQMFEQGHFGTALSDKGPYSLVEDSTFDEFELDSDVDVLKNKMLDSFSFVGKSRSIPMEHINAIQECLPKGEFVIFASMQRDKGVAFYSFISNRRAAYSVEEHNGVLYAKNENALSQIRSIELKSGALTLEIDDASQLSFGATRKEVHSALLRRLSGEGANGSSLNLAEILNSLSGRSRQDFERFSNGEEPSIVFGTWFSGILAAWDDRVAIIKQGLLTGFVMGSKQQSNLFYLDDVSNITIEKFGTFGLGGGAIQIVTPSNPSVDLSKHSPSMAGVLPNVYFWTDFDSRAYQELGTKLQSLLIAHKARKSQKGNSAPSANASSLSQELRELREMFETGVLTEDEFSKAKAKLLG